MAMMMRGPLPGPTKPISRTTLQRIARTFAPYKPAIIGTTLAVLASAGLGLLSPFFLRTIVNQGLLGHDMGVVTRYTILPWRRRSAARP
jgi:ATP-binding cassette subfamily B protein